MEAAVLFVGASVDDVLGFTAPEGCPIVAAKGLLAAMQPIGRGFELPWKFRESLDVFLDDLPAELGRRLDDPGSGPPENHVEAALVALALEVGVTLQPLDRCEMQCIQATVAATTERDDWGRQSPHPWDTVAGADLCDLDFFALLIRV